MADVDLHAGLGISLTRVVDTPNDDVFVAATNMLIVKHGAVAGTARPTADSVYWQGSVEPTNRVLGDWWLNTNAYD